MLELLAQTTTEVHPKIQRWAMAAMVGILLVIVLVVTILVLRSITRSVRRNYLEDGSRKGDTPPVDAWSESAARVSADDADLDAMQRDDDDELRGPSGAG